MTEIDTGEKLRALLTLGRGLAGVVVQALDLRPLAAELTRVPPSGAVFLGCTVDACGFAV
jgi:hypothetical protein